MGSERVSAVKGGEPLVSDSVGEQTESIPRGKPASGRVWKSQQSTRASAVKTKAVKQLSTSWEEKRMKKRKLADIKEREKSMKEAKRSEIERKKQEKLDKEKRRLENEMKATSFQVISKTHKLKSMSRKQLRGVKKMRMNKLGVVELAPMGA